MKVRQLVEKLNAYDPDAEVPENVQVESLFPGGRGFWPSVRRIGHALWILLWVVVLILWTRACLTSLVVLRSSH